MAFIMAVRSKQKVRKKKSEVAGDLLREEVETLKIDTIDNLYTYLL